MKRDFKISEIKLKARELLKGNIFNIIKPLLIVNMLALALVMD